ncbi:MAG: glycosyltransferase family 4 protein [Bacteroidales bacterium]
MRVLFVIKSKSTIPDISPFVLSQLNSLQKNGVEVGYFPVHGSGIFSYIKGIKQLRAFLKKNKFDLIHAHYSLCGWTAVLSRCKTPIVLSLMGSDAMGEYVSPNKIKFSSNFIILLTLLIQPFVDAIISKAENINKRVYRKKIAHIIPNGVDLDKVITIDKNKARSELGLTSEKKYILFLNNPNNKWKNISLVKKALEILSDDNLELLTPYPVSAELVVKYLNASDVFITTSFMEGSPNVIKEAMACNCPIVSTNAGDTKWVVGKTKGCYITSFDSADVKENLKKALDFAKQTGKTQGRQRILEIGLDSSSIAQRIIEVYKNVLPKPKVH